MQAPRILLHLPLLQNNMKLFFRHIIILSTFLTLALSLQTAFAQPILPKPNSLSGPTESQQQAIKGQGSTTGGYGVTVLIPFITRFSIGVAGSLSLMSFVYGGFLYVISFGDEGQTEKGKKIMIWAAVGLGIAMLSYALVAIVLKIKIVS